MPASKVYLYLFGFSYAQSRSVNIGFLSNRLTVVKNRFKTDCCF